jgi:predicted nucleic acid-binding protein
MMKPVIVDTETISYFFRRNSDVMARVDECLQEYGFVSLSVITYYEVLNGLYFKNSRNQMTTFERFVSLNEVLPLTSEIAKKSVEIHTELRTNGQIVSHNDVLIAGTAIVNDLTLITNNVTDFSHIGGLDIINWSRE